MLTGRYEYNLDAKSRMNFPPKFREEMGETVYITKWLDGCIAVYGEEKWNELNGKLNALPQIKSRELLRFIYGSAQDVTLDKQGRILLPRYLKEHAEIEKDIVVIGVGDHAEIWNRRKYDEYENRSKTEIDGLLKMLEI